MGNNILRVGPEYGSDLQKAKKILRSVAHKHQRVLQEPSPSVQLIDLAGESLISQERFWIDSPSRRRYSDVRSDFLHQVLEQLVAADIGAGTVTDLDMTGELSVQSKDG